MCESNVSDESFESFRIIEEIGSFSPKFTSIGKPLQKYVLSPRKKRGVDVTSSDQLMCMETNASEEVSSSSVVEQRENKTGVPTDGSTDISGTSAQDLILQKCKSELIILGTGSAIPSKYRNVSSMLLFNMEGTTVLQSDVGGNSQHGHILLDCGEGTYGQLWNFCKSFTLGNEVKMPKAQGCHKAGLEALVHVLRKIQVVWISHKHADHLLGLPQILSARYKLVGMPLFVVGPKVVQLWLDEYSNAMKLDDPSVHLHYKFVNADFLDSSFTGVNVGDDENDGLVNARCFLDQIHLSLGVSRIQTTEVVHCRKSFALKLEHASGWSLVYSGDTRPCENVVRLGQGATILIHEATFEDGMEESAIQKRHSTTSEAIGIGRKMAAGHIVLTHFSQRYPKLPSIKGGDCLHQVSIAHDLMRISFADIHTVPALYSSLQTLLEQGQFTKDDGE